MFVLLLKNNKMEWNGKMKFENMGEM